MTPKVNKNWGVSKSLPRQSLSAKPQKKITEIWQTARKEKTAQIKISCRSYTWKPKQRSSGALLLAVSFEWIIPQNRTFQN